MATLLKMEHTTFNGCIQVLQLISCNCKKSKCIAGACNCRSHGLPCTDLCGCPSDDDGCENRDTVDAGGDAEDEDNDIDENDLD